jgi:ribosomal-protein-alanine N-acetyltransferase
MDYSKFKCCDVELSDLNEVVVIENNSHFSPWSKKSFEGSMRAKNTFKVFLEKKKIIGYYIALIAQDQCELLNITVTKSYQSLGLGNFMLRHLISFCKAKKVANIFLEVRVSNIVAIRLYDKNGFNELGVRDNYYRTLHGKEDGLLMGYTFDL